MKKEMLEQAVLDYINEKFKDKVLDKRVQTFFTYSELVDTVLSFAHLKSLERENTKLDMKRKAERQIFQGIVEKKNEQLTKATEIIKEFVSLLTHTRTALDTKTVMQKAEQFIKEIEK